MVGDWKTFTDFLLSYFAERIGRRWIHDEMRKGDGHPIGQWATAMRNQPSAQPVGVIAKSKANNGFRSLLSAAYNLYLIEHHYEQYDEPLFERLLSKLRVPNDFPSSLSETNAAASFLKAGFLLKYEDDLRPGHHAEFTATYPLTGRRFSVEVKTRTGALVDDDQDLISRVKLKNKLSQALKKQLPWTRVVFIDLNIPLIFTGIEGEFFDNMLAAVEDAERTLKIRGAPAPSAYLFLVNQPFHFNLNSLDGAPMAAALGFRLDTFNPPRPASFREIVLGRDQHPEMHALIDSMKIHGEPPSTFDGQHPEFAFGDTTHPRWIVGNNYLVPGPNNEEVKAVLQSAIAIPEQQTMHGVFLAKGAHFIAQAPMTEAEVSAYKRSPNTFFGIVQDVGRNAKDALELAEFFYETYQHTPKEKLPEFLSKHPELERLRALSQKDLAIFVCEQWALSAEAAPKRKNEK